MCENHIYPNFKFMQAILVSIKWTVVWAFVSLTDTGVLCCALGCVCVCVCVCVSFDEVVVSTSGFPFQLFVGHHPTKCIYEESQAAPKYAALYSVSEVLLASISEEILTLRDLARLVMHKNKIFHSGKKFYLSECS